MVRPRSRLEEKSHKGGPIADGGMPYELASGNKSLTVPGSAKNLIRESHKEGPIADGGMPYELPACGRMPYELPTCTEDGSVIKKKLCEMKKQQGVRSSYE